MVTAALASLTLLLTGLRQVFGFREKWATRTWALISIEHEINLYQLNRAQGGDAAGRRLVMQVDAIVAEETHGWAERLRASGTAATAPSPVVNTEVSSRDESDNPGRLDRASSDTGHAVDETSSR